MGKNYDKSILFSTRQQNSLCMCIYLCFKIHCVYSFLYMYIKIKIVCTQNLHHYGDKKTKQKKKKKMYMKSFFKCTNSGNHCTLPRHLIIL